MNIQQKLASAVRATKANLIDELTSGLPNEAVTEGQRVLMSRHGTPFTFAAACCNAIGDFISVDEAVTAIRKYDKKWRAS